MYICFKVLSSHNSIGLRLPTEVDDSTRASDGGIDCVGFTGERISGGGDVAVLFDVALDDWFNPSLVNGFGAVSL